MGLNIREEAVTRTALDEYAAIPIAFRAAEDWAGARGCRWLTIETQNVNVAACRFYRKMGCTLGAIDRFAYPGLPGEVQPGR